MPRPLRLVAIVLLTSAAAPVEEPVPRILDATPEYCHSLAGRLALLPGARLEPSRSLGEQGVKLCGEGNLRIGVAKLRRALRAAQGPRSSASAPEPPAAGARSFTR